MPLFETFSIALLAALGWFWFDSVRARDIAGRLVLRRAYAFEFSVDGNDRRPGSIVLLGQQVLFVNVGLRLAQP